MNFSEDVDFTCKAMLDISSVRCNISIETKCAKNKFIESYVIQIYMFLPQNPTPTRDVDNGGWC